MLLGDRPSWVQGEAMTGQKPTMNQFRVEPFRFEGMGGEIHLLDLFCACDVNSRDTKAGKSGPQSFHHLSSTMLLCDFYGVCTHTTMLAAVTMLVLLLILL